MDIEKYRVIVKTLEFILAVKDICRDLLYRYEQYFFSNTYR